NRQREDREVELARPTTLTAWADVSIIMRFQEWRAMPPCSGGRVSQTQPDRRALFEREALPLMEVLYGGALKLTRNPRDAEDLVQDTYWRAFERFHLFKPGTNLKAWMFRVMTNRFINLYLSRKARPGVTGVENLENHGIEDDGVLLRD